MMVLKSPPILPYESKQKGYMMKQALRIPMIKKCRYEMNFKLRSYNYIH